MDRYCLWPENRREWTAAFLSFFLFLLFLFSSPSAVKGEVVDRIVAVVNDDIILQSELNRELQPIIQQIQSAGYEDQKKKEMTYKYREDILDKMIEEKLTRQEIERKKIFVSEKEIDSAVEQIKRANYYTDEELRGMLITKGMDMDAYRDLIKEQILQSKLVDLEIKSKVVITPSDIQSYYEKNKEKYKGEKKYHLRNLMMPISSFAGEKEKSDARQRMESIRVRLKNGQPFDKTDTVGRDIGFVGENKLSPQLREALKDLNPGEYSEVLDTDQGMQIFYVQDIQFDTGKSLGDASAEIERSLYNDIVKKRFRDWMDELRENSHIKIIR